MPGNGTSSHGLLPYPPGRGGGSGYTPRRIPEGAAYTSGMKTHLELNDPHASSRAAHRVRTGLALLLSAVFTPGALSAAGPAPVNLRSTASFTILAGAAVTTTGGGIINGDVGASPIAGSAIHLTDAQVNGTIYTVDASGPAGSVVDPGRLSTAKGDLTLAYIEARDRTPVPSGPFLNPGAGNIGGLNLIPGLYKFTGTAFVTGSDLTLTGGPDDVWIFQIASDLQVGSSIRVLLAGGAQARNIYWQVGTSAVIETFAVFKGTILADQAITMRTSSTMEGRALAFEAGVTYNGTGGALPVPKAPRLEDIHRVPGGPVTLRVQTTPYFVLRLQRSPSLVSPSWTTIATETPDVTPWTFTTAQVPGQPVSYYRTLLTPY